MKEEKAGGNAQMGFVYQKVPHITLKSIANNADIDAIWEEHEKALLPLRKQLSDLLSSDSVMEEWEVPREKPEGWPKEAESILTQFWKRRIARQKEIDDSIASKADFEYLWDKPYEDKNIVRVAGPFTVESLSPHHMLTANEDGDFVDSALEKAKAGRHQANGMRKARGEPGLCRYDFGELAKGRRAASS